jgi:hypothetical protein
MREEEKHPTFYHKCHYRMRLHKNSWFPTTKHFDTNGNSDCAVVTYPDYDDS